MSGMLPNKQQKRSHDDVASGKEEIAQREREILLQVYTDGCIHQVAKILEDAKAEAQKAAAEILENAKAGAKEVAAKIVMEAEAVGRNTVKAITKQGHEALEAERIAMAKANSFQAGKVLLNVGGRNFETSLDTLRSIPGTYLESMFSGRHEITQSDAKGRYFIDRSGKHFQLILNYLRDSGTVKVITSDMTAGQMKAFMVEAGFYGLLDHMMPYHAQEVIGESLLRRACLTGTRREQQTAVAQVGALVFEIGSTTPFLTDEFQDMRFVITDQFINGAPVWDAVGSKYSMYRNAIDHMQVTIKKERRVEGKPGGTIMHEKFGGPIVAPTELPPNQWLSCSHATLESQYASGERGPFNKLVRVPAMRITVVHGLDAGNPAMALVLQKLAVHVDDSDSAGASDGDDRSSDSDSDGDSDSDSDSDDDDDDDDDDEA